MSKSITQDILIPASDWFTGMEARNPWPESQFRVMRRLGMFPQKKKKAYTPYQQMTHPGEGVDVKVVPRRCIIDLELRLFQYTAPSLHTRT